MEDMLTVTISILPHPVLGAFSRVEGTEVEQVIIVQEISSHRQAMANRVRDIRLHQVDKNLHIDPTKVMAAISLVATIPKTAAISLVATVPKTVDTKTVAIVPKMADTRMVAIVPKTVDIRTVATVHRMEETVPMAILLEIAQVAQDNSIFS